MIHLVFRQVKAWISFDEKNAFIFDLLHTLDHIALLVINVVQLAGFFEDMAAKTKEVDIVAGVEVVALDLHDLGEDRAVLDSTFG